MEIEVIHQPITLWDQSLSVCVNHPKISLINYDPDSMEVDSEDGIEVQSYEKQYFTCSEFKSRQFIPNNISERLFQLILKKHPEYFLYIFTDTKKCCLTKLNLDIEDTSFQLQDQQLLSLLFFHPLREINLSRQEITHNTLSSLKFCQKTLKVLDLSHISVGQFSIIKELKNLEKLNLEKTNIGCKKDEITDIGKLPKLKWLNLSQTEVNDESLRELIPLGSKLTWLSLYQCSEINDEKNFIEVLSHFPNLTYLDVSKDPPPDQVDVACTKDTLPSPIVTEDIMKQAAKFRHLKYLDISACIGLNSNAAFRELADFRSVSIDITKSNLLDRTISTAFPAGIYLLKVNNRNTRARCEICSKLMIKTPELCHWRRSGSPLMKNMYMEPFEKREEPLQFLGLLKTGISQNSNVPATKVTGEANEEQILTSLEVYSKRAKYISVALRKLFMLATHRNCNQTERCLKLILKSMRSFKNNNSIHIAATASLYHLTREEHNPNITPNKQLRRDVISALLDTMENLKGVLQLQKNACLTLCNFKIPMEVDFQYFRVAELLLAALRNHKDDYLRRIAIMLFNAILCQNVGDQKKEIGVKGGIQTILQIIREKLFANEPGNLMETCWSSLWNITDETPENCEDFLNNNGMTYFVECLKNFPDSLELHRNIMGLMGNVAEVKKLRPRLMTEEYIKIFITLLDKEVEGLEVSYNSAGLLSHILSDGQKAWTVECVTRDECMQKVMESIDKWEVTSSRNINYRSFKPILRLLESHDSPASQYWATWALANLTKVYPHKYCRLVENEGGLVLLQTLIDAPTTLNRIKVLARSVFENHKNELKL